MTVDIRLNQMISALDERMKYISLDHVELSIRTYKALKDCGVHTLHDAQMAIINRQLHKQHGIGPKAVKEVEEIIFNVRATLPAYTSPQNRMELHSLLLAHESAVIALYDIQRADADPDDFLGIDRDGSIHKRQVTVARIRETILNKLKAEA
jgi:hypothetical protein